MVSAMADLRIFSYLPNPRIWKATIAARLSGVDLEVRGAKPSELTNWLWDFDARPLSAEEKGAYASAARKGRVGFKGGSLIKSDAFLSANPFGTVPAAFSPDGTTGVFESNSIMRAVARRHPLARRHLLRGRALPVLQRTPAEGSAAEARLAAGPGRCLARDVSPGLGAPGSAL